MHGPPVRSFAVSMFVGILVALLQGSAVAATITFDFEELPVQVSSLLTSTKGDLTVSIRRQDGASFAVAQTVCPPCNGDPASWGLRYLAPASQSSPFVFNFSVPVSVASLAFGDYGFDDDGLVTLTAFSQRNASGAELDRASVNYPSFLDIAKGDADVRTLSVTADGILSLLISSNGTFPNSLAYDNLQVTPTAAPIPEPAVISLIGGALVLIRHRTREREWPAA